MRLRDLSLRTRITASFFLILFLGGLSTSLVGVWVTHNAILGQARKDVAQDLVAAHVVYEDRLRDIKNTVELVASGNTLQPYMAEGPTPDLETRLRQIQVLHGLDFLSLTDRQGNVIARSRPPHIVGDNVRGVAPVASALAGRGAMSTEILSAEQLAAEGQGLAERARIRLAEAPPEAAYQTSGMVLLAAEPVRDEAGRLLGALYGGCLINNNCVHPDGSRDQLVDRIKATVVTCEKYEGRDIGIVAIYQGDVQVSTSVVADNGCRAIGTRAPQQVRQAVLERGQTWRDLAFVVNDWYISAFEPIRNLAGERIGILHVGMLQRPFVAVRNQVVLAFFAIAAVCLVLVMGTNYMLTRHMTRPLDEMVAVTRRIAEGDFSHRVAVTSGDELGKLAASFNAMLERITEMRNELQEWARTLEQKVKQRTDELVAIQTKMAESEKLASLGQLAAGVAHEINNPLGGILSFAELLREDLEPDDPKRDYVDEIVQQAVRCRDIVKGLLDFARQSDFQMSLTNLNNVVQSTLSLLERQAIFHDIEIVRELDPDMPLTMMDGSQIQQVIMNIVLNAVDAMEEEGILTIRTGKWDDPPSVFVEITDTGRGIAPEHIGHIFDPFYTTKEVGKGTGLGLAVAHGIVTRHGGQIRVHSEVGRGTTFTVILPLRQSEDQADQQGSGTPTSEVSAATHDDGPSTRTGQTG